MPTVGQDHKRAVYHERKMLVSKWPPEPDVEAKVLDIIPNERLIFPWVTKRHSAIERTTSAKAFCIALPIRGLRCVLRCCQDLGSVD